MGDIQRGRRTGVMLGLSALALTASVSAAGIGTSAADQSPEPELPAAAPDTAELSAAENVAQEAPRIPALEVGATPLGARRPVSLDGPRAAGTGALPGPAAYAYTFASSALEEAEPGCGLRWSLLAAIGRIESDHGRSGSSRLGDQGVVSPAMRGARLDGSRGTSIVRDTDAGDLDGSARFDRAIGPMQLLPSTWGVVGVDADGDGKRDPDDIDDAALGAAVLLCGAPGRLTTDGGLAEALERYNAAPGYAAAVTELEREYRRAGVPVATLGNASSTLGPTPSAPSASMEALITGSDTSPSPSPSGTGGNGDPQNAGNGGNGKGGKHAARAARAARAASTTAARAARTTAARAGTATAATAATATAVRRAARPTAPHLLRSAPTSRPATPHPSSPARS